MYIIRPMKTKEILISIPILYLLFLIFLDYCTIRELYGISSLGLDKTPNYIDALLVVFVFTMIEYVSAFITLKISRASLPMRTFPIGRTVSFYFISSFYHYLLQVKQVHLTQLLP